MITPELTAAIRRLFYVEHWKIGTIAEHLRLSWHTVQRAVSSERSVCQSRPRPSGTDSYLPLIRQILERYPRLRAPRVFEMLKERGYTGRVVPVRRAVARLRPSLGEAFLRLRSFPGEQAQVDWAHFGQIAVGKAPRRLSCFVLTLSYSRALYLEFFYDQSLESFLKGHVHAFEDLSGVPRTILYDNLRSAVLSRHGDTIEFHPRLIEFCGHYRFAPRACAVGKGNQKGRVERAIQYIRHSFFAARAFTSLFDLNQKARLWRDEIAHHRNAAEDDRRSVQELLDEERPRLLPLPVNAFETDLVLPVHSQKTPYVRFDLNDYSIPDTFHGKPLTLVASDTTVRLLSGAEEIARHRRSYSRHEQVEDPRHLRALRAKKQARDATLPARLMPLQKEIDAFLRAALEKGESKAPVTQKLLQLRDDYGLALLKDALVVAVKNGTPRVSSVAYLLDKSQRQKRRRLPMPITLTTRPELADLSVTPAEPEIYDELSFNSNDDDAE